MDNSSTAALTAAGTNLADRAVHSADQALDATRQVANHALDQVSDRVHAAHARVSPVLNRVIAPVDRVTQRTREQPIQTLLIAAASGAALMALIGLIRGR